MDFWYSLVIGAHVVIALGIIGLVLLQHGKGADMGSGFGGGSSGSLFGATGSANFLSRTTAVLAALFFLSSLGLAYLATKKPDGSGVMDRVPAAAKPAPERSVPVEKPAAAPAKPAPDPEKQRQVPQ